MRSSDAAAGFERVVRPFQRRLRTRLFVRVLPLTFIASLTAVSLVVLVFEPGLGGSLLACGVALMAAIGGAGIWAFVKTPSPLDTARVIDHHFRLDDCTVTALQFAGAADPISELIVLGARERLAHVQSTRLPLGSAPAVIRLSAYATTAVTLAIVLMSARQQPATAPLTGASTALSNAAGQAAGAQPPRGETSTQRAASTRQLIAPGSQPSALPRRSTDTAPSNNAGATTSRPALPERAGDSADRDLTRAGGERNSSAPAMSSPTAAAGLALDGRGVRGPGSGAGGRGGQSVTLRSTSAGGISGGDLTDDRRARRDAAPADALMALTRAASAGIETPAGDARVPPRLRTYVRDYFISIGRRTRQ